MDGVVFPWKRFNGIKRAPQGAGINSKDATRLAHLESPNINGVIQALCWPFLFGASCLEGFSSVSLFIQIIIPTKPAQNSHLAPFSEFTSTCVNKPRWILTDGLMSSPGLWALLGPESPIPRSSTAPNPPNAGVTFGVGETVSVYRPLLQAQHHVKCSTST